MAAIQSEDLFGSEEGLASPRLIKEYLQRVRRVSRAGSQALEDDYEMIYQVIASSPGIPMLFGHDMKRKAQSIVEPLGEAANAYTAAANLSILAWQRMYKAFKPALEASPRSNTRGRQTMDWTDV